MNDASISSAVGRDVPLRVPLHLVWKADACGNPSAADAD
jgi:hypothetical protein